MKKKLFREVQLGKLKLKNAVVMAPMTRSRALGNLANDLIALYYSQRASAGLIITEGVSPSPNGLGYARIPGLFNKAQSDSWKPVTDSVHQRGARIFLQLMHTGRVSHPANMPKGSKILAPSPVALTGQIWTDTEGMQNHPVPAEMSQNEIKATIAEFADSASLAMDAGFDGVELHSANGYLLEQFLHPKTNLRKDEYGGNAERRQKFVLDVAEAVSQKIGADRTGIRISPYGAFNDMGEFEEIKDFYSSLTKRLSNLGLAYIHIVDHSSMGAPKVNPEIKKMIRKEFQGKVILSGGYTAESAEADLQENKGDLIAFGRPFIANPNLVEKLEQGLPILEANPATFYTPGKEGFTDYAS